MPRLVDCFLFNDEIELLDIRLGLLAPVVDRFVIVWAEETFTGLRKEKPFPAELPSLVALGDRVELVRLSRIRGDTAWQKESFSRNALSRGIVGLDPADLVMVSDVDEIPRPVVVEELKRAPPPAPTVLVQDYFNFKFNYQLLVGLQAAWAGPVVCPFGKMTSPQELRDLRWRALHEPGSAVHDAGWHFSFLTAGDDVAGKLSSFSHQEREVQSRTDAVGELIAARSGFHDHIHPGAVWSIIEPSAYRCERLAGLLGKYPRFMLHGAPDDAASVRERLRLVVNRMDTHERQKILRRCRPSELVDELWRRLARKIGGTLDVGAAKRARKGGGR